MAEKTDRIVAHQPDMPSAVKFAHFVAISTAFGCAAIVFLGWTLDIQVLTRGRDHLPPMTPWSAVLVCGLAISIRLQSAGSSLLKIRCGQSIAVLAFGISVAMLMEYLTKSSFSIGLDELWFRGSVNEVFTFTPGRPGQQALVGFALISVGVAVSEVESPRSRSLWAISLISTGVLAVVQLTAYFFGAHELVIPIHATGTSFLTTAATLLLVIGGLSARSDRNPLAWLISRPDTRPLAAVGGALAGIPLVIALLRAIGMGFGLSEEAADAIGVAGGVAVSTIAVFYLTQRQLTLLAEREALARKHAEAQARYRIIAENSADVVIHLRGPEVIWVSQSVEAAFGDTPQQWIGADFLTRVHPEDEGILSTTLQEIASATESSARFRVRTAGNSYRWVEIRGKPFITNDGNPDGATGAIRVIDDQVEMERQLRKIAVSDPLTGLLNRREILRRLELCLQQLETSGQESEIGVLFCDIDHFKEINDQHGHTVGDVVLAAVSDRMRCDVRSGDAVGRIGGDEFLIIAPGLRSLDEAVQIGESIRRIGTDPISHSGRQFNATLSVGATLAVRGETVALTIARADAAMYQAKKDGRNALTAF